ncbi:hypothetical protein [Alienimonas sp. DA493]|uniref:hypothetical protein n=1 Tax=Alienimonas sp. DA493 TaxID=3373605 RepID=UPI003755120B
MDDTVPWLLFSVYIGGAISVFVAFGDDPDGMLAPQDEESEWLPQWAWSSIYIVLCLLWPVMFAGAFLWALARAVRRTFNG